jgi:hypothetical protein
MTPSIFSPFFGREESLEKEEIAMARTTPLVCQFLENISRAVLEEYQDLIREYTKNRHGIYSLYRKDKLYYVGLASNLRSRLKQHLKDAHRDKWDSFSLYITIDLNAIKELESLLLRVLRPEGNRTGGRFVKAENLRRKLVADIRARHRDKEHALMPLKKRPVTKKVPPVVDDETIPLAKYVRQRMRLRVRYKGKLYKAILRKDGQIRYNGVNYKTPSAAGSALRDGRATNGWQFWHYERAPGDWVPLAKMRS